MRLALLLPLLLAAACASPASPGFMAVYRWQVKAGCDAEFVAAWHAEAQRYRDRFDSQGTWLLRADDGTYVATAFWPSEEAWKAAPRPIDLPKAEAVLNRCIQAKVEELHLTPVDRVAARR